MSANVKYAKCIYYSLPVVKFFPLFLTLLGSTPTFAIFAVVTRREGKREREREELKFRRPIGREKG